MTNPFTRALDAELRGSRVRVTSSEGTFVGWVERMHHQQRHVLLRAASRLDDDGEILDAMGSTFIAHAETIETIDPVEIQAIPLDQLEPAPYAAREFDPLENGAYISQVRDEGWVGSYPTVRYVDGTTYEILEGHKRIWVAEQAGLSSHPVEIADSVSDWEAARWFVDDHFPDPEQVDGEETTADGYYGADDIETAVEELVSKWGEQAFELERVSWNAARLGLDVLDEEPRLGEQSSHGQPEQTDKPDGSETETPDGPISCVERIGYKPPRGLDYSAPDQQREPDYTNEEDLREAYEETDTIAEAAERFTVGYGAVRRRMVEAGIHRPASSGETWTATERVISTLESEGESTVSALTDVADVTTGTAHTILSELQADDVVKARRDPEDGRRKLYRLVEEPDENERAHEVGDQLDEDELEEAEGEADENPAGVDDAVQARLPDGVTVDDVDAAVPENGTKANIEDVAHELGMAVDATRSVLTLTDNYGRVREGARMRGDSA